MPKIQREFRPMLAATVSNLEKLEYPLLGSPKLDGIRAVVRGGAILGRSLKPIPNETTQEFFNQIKLLDGVDGELVVGRPTAINCFNRTSSGVMTIKDDPSATYYVFDYDGPQSYSIRQTILSQIVQKIKSPRVILLQQEVIKSAEEAREVMIGYLNHGYEGLMLRHPDGIYKYGRSSVKEGYLMKLKEIDGRGMKDSEAKIIGFKQLMVNRNEAVINKLGLKERSQKKEGLVGAAKLGALVVKDLYTGVEFNLGSGFDGHDKKRLWLMRKSLPGRIVKYKFQEVGVKEKPRFPVFLGFRDPIDL